MVILTHGNAQFVTHFAIPTIAMNLVMEQPIRSTDCSNSTILDAALNSVEQSPPAWLDRDTILSCSVTNSIIKLLVHVCAVACCGGRV